MAIRESTKQNCALERFDVVVSVAAEAAHMENVIEDGTMQIDACRLSKLPGNIFCGLGTLD